MNIAQYRSSYLSFENKKYSFVKRHYVKQSMCVFAHFGLSTLVVSHACILTAKVRGEGCDIWC